MDAHEQELTDKEALVAATHALTAMTAQEARDRRTQLFLKRIQDAAVAAGKGSVRLRIQPQAYDAVKNVYVSWPDKGWNVHIDGIMTAPPVLELVGYLLTLVQELGVDDTRAALERAEQALRS